MLGNYKKTAYVKGSYEEFCLLPDANLEISIKTNTNFKANKFIANFYTGSLSNFVVSNIFENWNINTSYYEIENNQFEINLKSITSDKVILEFIPIYINAYNGFFFEMEGIFLIE